MGHGGEIRHDRAVFRTHSTNKIFDDWIYEGKVPTGEVVREGALQLNSEGYVRRYLARSGLEKGIAAENGAIGLTDTSRGDNGSGICIVAGAQLQLATITRGFAVTDKINLGYNATRAYEVER